MRSEFGRREATNFGSRSTPEVRQTSKAFCTRSSALTYDEPFEDMCLPDVCLTDPAKAVLFSGETRRTSEMATSPIRTRRVTSWPARPAVRGVLGRLLGALDPTQRFDHVVLFVGEDDGNTVRHCTPIQMRG